MHERTKGLLIGRGITAICGLAAAQVFRQSVDLSGLIREPYIAQRLELVFLLVCGAIIQVPKPPEGGQIVVAALMYTALGSVVVACIEKIAVYVVNGTLLSSDFHYTVVFALFAIPITLAFLLTLDLTGVTKSGSRSLSLFVQNPWFTLIAGVCGVLGLLLSISWKDIVQGLARH